MYVLNFFISKLNNCINSFTVPFFFSFTIFLVFFIFPLLSVYSWSLRMYIIQLISPSFSACSFMDLSQQLSHVPYIQSLNCISQTFFEMISLRSFVFITPQDLSTLAMNCMLACFEQAQVSKSFIRGETT